MEPRRTPRTQRKKFEETENRRRPLIVFLSVLCALCGLSLASCERAPRKVEEPSPSPSASVAEASSEAEPAGSSEVSAPATVNLDAQNRENQLVKEEVLSRIDAMPNLTPEEKDRLYVQVERARGMGKIMIVPFGSGQRSVSAANAAALQEKIQGPQIQKFTEDPTVVFVVLGFADKKGDEKKNLAISLQRAENLAKALKDRCGIVNIIHAVGMGGSEIFDAQNLDKNRVGEIWVVLP